jgi:phage I-like protein
MIPSWKLRSIEGGVITSLSFAINGQTAKEVQLLPAGRFKSIDGRPASMAACKEWVMDAEAAKMLIAAASARQDAYVIDYEHQTLMKEQNGQPAPAAGWFKGMEWREGVGLFGLNVEWTPKAAQAIKEGEYRYISPVIRFDPDTGRVTGLTMAALTNYAGIDGMQQASLSKLSADSFDHKNALESVGLNLTDKQFANLVSLSGVTAAAFVEAVKSDIASKQAHNTAGLTGKSLEHFNAVFGGGK